MRVTVLGGSAACPNPGQGCSGYLVEHDGAHLLLDCGPNTLSVLRAHVEFRAIDAIVISHTHSDHTLDLVPYRYGLRYAPGGSGHRLALWMPPGGAQFLERLSQVFALGSEQPSAFFEDVFAIREYDPTSPLEIGPFTLMFQPTQHFIPCWAMRIEAGKRVLVYFADSGPATSLIEFARGSHLAVCEGTYLNQPQEAPSNAQGHLTANQAGELAAAAGAERLLLTHLWAELGFDRYKAEAEAGFGQSVMVAHPGLTIDV